MKKKGLIKIINESIASNDFDFLDLNRTKEEEQTLETLNDYFFQKKFLYDLFFNKPNIEIGASEAHISIDFDPELISGNFNIKYSTEIKHNHENEIVEFDCVFDGDVVKFKIENTPLDGQKKIIVDWESINYEFYTKNGDVVDFSVFEKIEDPRIERMFLREFIGYFIEKRILD